MPGYFSGFQSSLILPGFLGANDSRHNSGLAPGYWDCYLKK
jgi:hypothetical protein